MFSVKCITPKTALKLYIYYIKVCVGVGRGVGGGGNGVIIALTSFPDACIWGYLHDDDRAFCFLWVWWYLVRFALRDLESTL